MRYEIKSIKNFNNQDSIIFFNGVYFERPSKELLIELRDKLNNTIDDYENIDNYIVFLNQIQIEKQCGNISELNNNHF